MSVDVFRFDDVNGDSNLMCDRVPASRFLVERKKCKIWAQQPFVEDIYKKLIAVDVEENKFGPGGSRGGFLFLFL